MLTVMPRHRSEEEALLAVARTVDRLKFNWERFLVGWCAAFHVATAVPLAFAPYEQILSAGTVPVFDMASRYVWAVAFLVAGLIAWALYHRQTAATQLLTWLTVFPLGVVWLLAFALAVLNDKGNAIGLTVWLFLYGPWILAALRIGLGKQR